MNKKHVVKLKLEERAEWAKIVAKGKAATWKIQRCYALLQCDQSPTGPGWKDADIAAAYGVTTRSVEAWRKQTLAHGPLSLLERQPRTVPATAFKLDGTAAARLTTLACSQPPEGHARWTLRLLADQLVVLEVVESLSHETGRQARKKRAKAVAQADGVYAARARRGVCLCHGAGVGGLSASVRPGTPGGVHG